MIRANKKFPTCILLPLVLTLSFVQYEIVQPKLKLHLCMSSWLVGHGCGVYIYSYHLSLHLSLEQ